MIFTSSTCRSIHIAIVLLLASCDWCIANNDPLHSNVGDAAGKQLGSVSAVEPASVRASVADKQLDKREADAASSATGKPSTTNNNNNNSPRSGELRDLSSTSTLQQSPSSSLPVAQYRAIYSGYPAYTKFYATAAAAPQIIYVKAPSNQQFNAAADGSAKLAYASSENYAHQAESGGPVKYQIVYTQSHPAPVHYQSQQHQPNLQNIALTQQSPSHYPSFVLSQPQHPQFLQANAVQPTQQQNHPTTFHHPAQQPSNQFQPLQTYSTAAPAQPYSTAAPVQVPLQSHLQPTYQYEATEKQATAAYQQYYQNQKQLQQHLLQQQQNQLVQQQQQLQHQQQQQQLYVQQQQQLQHHQLQVQQQHQQQQHQQQQQQQLQQQQQHQHQPQQQHQQQPQYHRAVQVQQHSNGAAATAAPTRSPIVYYASSSPAGHPAANNPLVHPYFAYSTAPPNVLHHLQPAVPTIAAPTLLAKQLKAYAAAPVASPPAVVHPHHHPQIGSLQHHHQPKDGNPTANHQGATSFATFTQQLSQQAIASPIAQTASTYPIFVKQQPSAQTHHQHHPQPLAYITDKDALPPTTLPTAATTHLIYGGGQNLLVAASQPHHHLVYANTALQPTDSSEHDAGTIHYGTHLFQPSIGRYSYSPVQPVSQLSSSSNIVNHHLQPQQQHRLVYA